MNEPNDQSIISLLEDHPRANLIQTPAVIHRLPRLSSYLGQDIYVLREDLTGFALGGNKTRKLEYLLGDAVAKIVFFVPGSPGLYWEIRTCYLRSRTWTGSK